MISTVDIVENFFLFFKIIDFIIITLILFS